MMLKKKKKKKLYVRTFHFFNRVERNRTVLDFCRDTGGYNNSPFLNVCIIKIMLLEISKA